jgi:predicted protein tyrosine phosphatase
MAETLAEVAAKKTCTALAEATGLVQIISFDPFKVKPENVLDLTFKDVAVNDDAAISIFKKAVATLVVEDLKLKVMGQEIDASSRIMLFSDFLEALLAQQELGGGK